MTGQGYTPLSFFIELAKVDRVWQVDGFTTGFWTSLQEGLFTFVGSFSEATYNIFLLVVLGYMDKLILDVQGFVDNEILDWKKGF